MRELRKVMTKAGLLGLALLPMIGAVSPDAASTKDASSRMPVAISQPLAAMERGRLVGMPSTPGAMLPESGMLVLVGSALMGLAAVVRRTTRAS